MHVQFLWFDGCPLAPRVRKVLNQALELLGEAELAYEEIDLLAPETPGQYAGLGSPTILVNGRDITGAEPGSAAHCRIDLGRRGVPEVKALLGALRSARGAKR